jgi:hypothetical protein
VCGALAEVAAQARCVSKVINNRSKGPKVTHMRSEEGYHIIRVNGGALPEARGS